VVKVVANLAVLAMAMLAANINGLIMATLPAPEAWQRVYQKVVSGHA